MIISLFGFLKRKDMFERAQYRLTLLYTGLLSLFLVLFVMVVYWLLTIVIYNEQKNDLLVLADKATKIIEEQIKENRQADEIDLDNRDLLPLGNDQFFYYLIASDGTLTAGKEAFPILRPELLKLVEGWKPGKQEIRYESINTQTVPPEEQRRELDSTDKLYLMITGKPVVVGNGISSNFYIAKNISPHHFLFQRLLLILIGVAFLFSIVAFFISRYMSHRAMIPIAESYERQRGFTADASHELRTPLSVLLMSINALELSQGDTEQMNFTSKTLSNMKDEVKRMTKLVGDLLLLARSDSSELEFANELFDFRLHAEKSVQSMETVAAAKGIGLELAASEKAFMRGDSERMKQVLYILLDNAIKFTPEGGQVRVELGTTRNYLRLSVKDMGPGVKPSDAARIFDRFYRTDKARSRRTNGHGLGLSIAKQIVEAHHGMITVSSKEGHGSTFHVSIPLGHIP